MHGSRHLLILSVIFFSLTSLAQEKLLNISHSNIDHNQYQVVFEFDQGTKFKVLPDENKIFIDFYDTQFTIKTLSKQKLDGKFLKTIRKTANDTSKLRIILELASNTRFQKTYSIIQANKLFVTVKLENNHLIKPKISLKQYVIMIDPGHGGSDNGTVGNHLKILEKNLTLSYARALKKELSKYPQYIVLMTREKDTYLSKETRQQKAHTMKADLFISLHADSNSDQNMRGASVYTLSQEALDQESAVLAERENKTNILKNDKILKKNKDIANVLIGMVYHDTKNASISLAKSITEALDKEVNMLNKSHRSAGFRVLKGVDIPAVLIELGYLSNQEEEKILISHKHKQILTQALVHGINKQLKTNQKT